MFCHGRGAATFRWTSTLLLAAVGVLGLLQHAWPRRIQGLWIGAHAFGGVLLWVLIIAALLWRPAGVPPVLPPQVGPLPRRARAMHAAIYLLLWVTPIVGMVAFVASDPGIVQPAEDAHAWLAYGLFALIAARLVAVLRRRIVRHDRISP